MVVKGMIPSQVEIADMFYDRARGKSKDLLVNIKHDVASTSKASLAFVHVAVKDVDVRINDDNIKISKEGDVIGTFDKGETGRDNALRKFEKALSLE